MAASMASIRDAAPSWMAARPCPRGTPPGHDPAGAPAGDVVDEAERQVQTELGADGAGDGLGDYFAGLLGQHQPPIRDLVSIEIRSIAEPAVWETLRHSIGNQPCQAPVPRATGSPRTTHRRRSPGIPAVVPTSGTMSERQWQPISRDLGQDSWRMLDGELRLALRVAR
jgi:hypothetical protein